MKQWSLPQSQFGSSYRRESMREGKKKVITSSTRPNPPIPRVAITSSSSRVKSSNSLEIFLSSEELESSLEEEWHLLGKREVMKQYIWHLSTGKWSFG